MPLSKLVLDHMSQMEKQEQEIIERFREKTKKSMQWLIRKFMKAGRPLTRTEIIRGSWLAASDLNELIRDAAMIGIINQIVRRNRFRPTIIYELMPGPWLEDE